MCYNTSINVPKLLEPGKYDFADKSLIAGFPELYHVKGFTFPSLPVIASNEPGKFQLFQWGLIPSWARNLDDALKIRPLTLNARSDTLYEKPVYRQSAGAGRRCIIPADGIFEWYALNKKKYPYYISMKEKEIFSIGGIWDEWVNRESGEVVRTFSMITTDANPLIARIHNDGKRMPLILPPTMEEAWLSDDLTKDEVNELFVPYPDDNMEAHTISKIINTKGLDSNVKEVQLKFDYAELSQPGLF